MAIMIEYRNVSKSYDGKMAVDDISLQIEEGDFLAVIGSSGCGKTTLMKMINGLVEVDSGEVFVNGENIKNKDLIALRRTIGYAIQGNVLFPHLNVSENIAYVPTLLKKEESEIQKIVEDKMKLVNLSSDLKNRYPSELSGGQQQRVGIARAYASSPKILLMDEPFGAVDAITRYELQRELKQIHEMTKTTIVFITHDISEALKLGTKILVMDAGKIQQLGTPQEILSSPANDFVKRLIELAQID